MKNPYALYPRPIGLARYLDRMPSLGAALMHARESARQSSILINAIPERAQRLISGVAVSGTTLVLKIETAEAAHLLRLMKPELLAKLDQKGLKFSEIQFRTQSPRSISPLPRRKVPQHASQTVSQSAEHIKSERLQTSLRRLAETLAKNTEER